MSILPVTERGALVGSGPEEEAIYNEFLITYASHLLRLDSDQAKDRGQVPTFPILVSTCRGS